MAEPAAPLSPRTEATRSSSAPSPAPATAAALEDDGPAPASTPSAGGGDDAEPEGDEDEAAGEDKGVDYRLLAKLGKKSAGSGIVIPKRGEKDFEPLELGVNIQERSLNRSREAMFGALTGVRGGSAKTMSHAHFPYPSTCSAYPSALPYLLLSRGNHFATMGHTVRPPKPAPSDSTPEPSEKVGSASTSTLAAKEPTTVLLPEEALYLLERGSLYIWRGEMDADAIGEAKTRDLGKGAGGGEVVEEVFARKAVRMTVQEGWAAWGDELKGGRYTVYAQLKRQGYIVHRAPARLPAHLRPAASSAPPTSTALPATPSLSYTLPRTIASLGLGLLRSPFALWHSLITFWRRLFGVRLPSPSEEAANARLSHPPAADAWTPLIHRREKVPRTYGEMFEHLRIVSAPTALPPPTSRPAEEEEQEEPEPSPYDIYYHVWRPNGNYRKSRPSEPDFKVGVVDARLHPLPPLSTFTHLFSLLSPLSPPPPRIYPNRPPRPQNPNYVPRPGPQGPSLLYRFLVWLRILPSAGKEGGEGEGEGGDGSRTKGKTGNPFPMLKQGDRSFILAVVDGGTVSWVRFGRGVFGGWGVQ